MFDRLRTHWRLYRLQCNWFDLRGMDLGKVDWKGLDLQYADFTYSKMHCPDF